MELLFWSFLQSHKEMMTMHVQTDTKMSTQKLMNQENEIKIKSSLALAHTVQHHSDSHLRAEYEQ